MKGVVGLVIRLLESQRVTSAELERRIEAIQRFYPSIGVRYDQSSGTRLYLSNGRSDIFCVDSDAKTVAGTFTISPELPPVEKRLHYVRRVGAYQRCMQAMRIAHAVARVLDEERDPSAHSLSPAQQKFCDKCG